MTVIRRDISTWAITNLEDINKEPYTTNYRQYRITNTPSATPELLLKKVAMMNYIKVSQVTNA